MKKFIFLLICACFFTPGISQNNQNSYFKDLGIFGGPGFNTILGGESWQGGFGFIAGVDSKIIPLGETSNIIGGIGFAFNNVPWEESFMEDGFSDYMSDYNYSGNSKFIRLFVPVLYNYVFDNNIYLEAGLQPEILISAKDKMDGETYDDKENYNVFNIAAVGGGGVQVNDKIGVGVRVAIDLLNMDSSDGMYYDESTKDQMLMIMAVLRISLWSPEN